jgi:glutamate-ammonia-ligase adenylyltransferase
MENRKNDWLAFEIQAKEFPYQSFFLSSESSFPQPIDYHSQDWLFLAGNSPINTSIQQAVTENPDWYFGHLCYDLKNNFHGLTTQFPSPNYPLQQWIKAEWVVQKKEGIIQVLKGKSWQEQPWKSTDYSPDWLSLSPDPDLGLLLIRNLLTGPRQSRQIAETFRESPAAAQSLCTIAGTSRLLGDVIAANPDLVARLPLPEQLVTKDFDGLVSTATASMEMRDGNSEQQASLRRWQQRNLLGIAARDLFDVDDVERVGRDLTTLAEATIESALQSLNPQIPFSVIGLGRFGAAELAYASDLDVMFVHQGSSADDIDEARRLSKSLMRMIAGSTPANRLYDIDCDLRPEGKNGPLSRGIDSYAVYWREHALTWERQAMTRARVVAGTRVLGDELLDELAPWVWGPGLSAEGIRDIRRMKARIEAERIPMGEDPDFHLKLGRGSLSDIEFTVQLLQLQYDVKATGTIDGLRALAQGDVLDPEDAAILAEAYEFCERVRNRWFLVNSAPSDSMPTQPESALWLARSLDTEPGALREHYRRVTRRSRSVVERVFYGLPSKK